jgi:cytochrome P450
MISALVAAEEQGEKLSAEETVAMCAQLLTAGHETTTQLIGNGTLALLLHPDELRKLRENPGLIASAIEEMLRFDSPAQRQTRLAAEDIEVGGKTIKKGATILFMGGAANRDPEEFPDPDRFDIARKPNRHIAFATGLHTCLGAPLARLEGAMAINTLLRRFPSLQLTQQRPEWREGLSLRGLKSLDVVF